MDPDFGLVCFGIGSICPLNAGYVTNQYVLTNDLSTFLA